MPIFAVRYTHGNETRRAKPLETEVTSFVKSAPSRAEVQPLIDAHVKFLNSRQSGVRVLAVVELS